MKFIIAILIAFIFFGCSASRQESDCKYVKKWTKMYEERKFSNDKEWNKVYYDYLIKAHNHTKNCYKSGTN